MISKNFRIIIDMDGVLANLPLAVIEARQKLRPWKTPLTIEDLIDYDLDIPLQEQGLMKLIFSLPHFFRDIPPIIGAKEFIHSIVNSKYEYEILISTILPSDNERILHDKLEWLDEHIFVDTNLSEKNVVFSYSKKWLDGNVMIDDYPKNLKEFDGSLPILIDWPYNKNFDEKKILATRINRDDKMWITIENEIQKQYISWGIAKGMYIKLGLLESSQAPL